MFFVSKKLTYAVNFYYENSRQTAIELRTHSYEEFRNLLLHLGYADIKTDYKSSAYFTSEFKDFLESSNNTDDLYTVYNDIPLSIILNINLPTSTVINHLVLLSKADNTGKLSWAVDTSSLLVKVMGMFKNIPEAADYFWENPQFLNEIYDNLDGHSAFFGKHLSNRIIFASLLNEIAKRKTERIFNTHALLNGNGYFIESNIMELNSTYNNFKAFMSLYWDFDFKKAITLKQRRTITKDIEVSDTNAAGDSSGEKKTVTVTETIDINDGYSYHPMHLVHYTDYGEKKSDLVTALFLKALADEKEWAEVMRLIRIGGDIFAIIAGLMTMGITGEASVLAIADLGLASIDLALMNDDVKKWVSDLPGGEWFVENWDTIYAFVGSGILSVVLIEGILTHGPALLDKIKNIKNVKGNYLTFTKNLENLVKELEAYHLANPTNVAKEVVIIGQKNGLLKKLLKLVSSPQENLQFIVEDIAKKGLSVKKLAENEYEVLYKGAVLKTGSDYEVGAFLKKYFWKSINQVTKEAVKDILKVLYSQLGKIRESAREILRNEDILINPRKGLQSSKDKLFKDLKVGEYKDRFSTYLWTIDERGINIAYEMTPFPTPRGNIVHSNISKKAYIAGEAWFINEKEVIINAGSGRFGDGAGITQTQWNAAVKFWENLGYNVQAVPFGKR